MKSAKPTHWIALFVLVLGVAQAQAGELLFEVSDPRGDDHGNGHLVYPIRSDYQKGDLDILSFAARSARGGTWFEVTFARPIRVADRQAIDDLGTNLSDVARLGFYTFNVDVYIDFDRREGSGWQRLLPGRHAELAPGHGWDRAVVLTPRPAEAKVALSQLMLQELRRSLREGDDQAELDKARKNLPADLDLRVYFPNRVRVRGQKVSFFVPDELLGGKALPDWSYTVAVSGADLIQSFDLSASMGLAESRREGLMILPISPGKWQDRFGGGREEEPLQPPLVDILVPPGTSQELLLSDFDSRAGRPARLMGVVPAEL
jgi:hypothetical protein